MKNKRLAMTAMFEQFKIRRQYGSLEREFAKRGPVENMEKSRRRVVKSIRGHVRARVFAASPYEFDPKAENLHWLLAEAIMLLPVDDIIVLNDSIHEGKIFEKLKHQTSRTAELYLQVLSELHDVAVLFLRKSHGDEGDGLQLWTEVVTGYQSELAESKLEAKRLTIEALEKKLLLAKKWGWPTAVAGMLALGWADMPDDFYLALRFVVCAAFGLWAWRAHELKLTLWRNALGLVAAAYNPFLPLRLERESWQWIDGFTLALAFVGAAMLARASANNSESPSDAIPASGADDTECT